MLLNVNVQLKPGVELAAYLFACYLYKATQVRMKLNRLHKKTRKKRVFYDQLAVT